MSIPVSIESLLEKNIVPRSRIECKEKWSPDQVVKTISAFANDFDNRGGGYVIIGVSEKNGVIKRPVIGLDPDLIDKIEQELIRYCKLLRPIYIPVTEVVEFEGKLLLMVWAPGGHDRPYSCPKHPSRKETQKAYYIRNMLGTVEANDEEAEELQMLARNVPFDDRLNIRSQLSDLKRPLIQDYLAEINSTLCESAGTMDMETLVQDLRIASEPRRFFKPVNAGLLFFCDRPEEFIPSCRIEVIKCDDSSEEGQIDKVFTGPIHHQLRDTLDYFKENILQEKVAESDGKKGPESYFNYSLRAIEEFLANAIFHRNYDCKEPITIRIKKESIEIVNVPGPDATISDIDLKGYRLRSHRYRNRRIGDFLRAFHLIEGQNMGIPKAISAIRANKSPLPIFQTDNSRSYFCVVMKIHPNFAEDHQ